MMECSSHDDCLWRLDSSYHSSPRSSVSVLGPLTNLHSNVTPEGCERESCGDGNNISSKSSIVLSGTGSPYLRWSDENTGDTEPLEDDRTSDDNEEERDDGQLKGTKRPMYTARGTTVLGKMGNQSTAKSRIVVAVRKRPLNSSELERGVHDVLVVPNESELELHEPKVKVDMSRYTHCHRYRFDTVLSEEASNLEVFNRTARGLLDTVMEGGSATCFAYGQTGSGKTHTMLGNHEEPGVYTLAIQDLFQRLADMGAERPWLSISFYEIYGVKLYDLLNGHRLLHCLEDEHRAVHIRGLSHHDAFSVEETMELLERGRVLRTSGSTSANGSSSRSHAILTASIHPGPSQPQLGKISFVDLAGNERGADTADATRTTRREGADINTSLLALKECIRSIDQRRSHVPFRSSKLTEVLRDSFLGNCRTVMIGAVSPGSNSCVHTMNTLLYAHHVKELTMSAAEKRTGRRTTTVLPPASAYTAAAATNVAPTTSQARGARKSSRIPGAAEAAPATRKHPSWRPSTVRSGSPTPSSRVSPRPSSVRQTTRSASPPPAQATAVSPQATSSRKRVRLVVEQESREAVAAAAAPIATAAAVERRQVDPCCADVEAAENQVRSEPYLSSTSTAPSKTMDALRHYRFFLEEQSKMDLAEYQHLLHMTERYVEGDQNNGESLDTLLFHAMASIQRRREALGRLQHCVTS